MELVRIAKIIEAIKINKITLLIIFSKIVKLRQTHHWGCPRPQIAPSRIPFLSVSSQFRVPLPSGFTLLPPSHTPEFPAPLGVSPHL